MENSKKKNAKVWKIEFSFLNLHTETKTDNPLN
jgi:hypothetical protein